MRNFSSCLFGGYEKDEVNEYVEHLVQELETLKDQKNEPAKELQNRVEELEQQLEEKQRQLELQRQQLADQTGDKDLLEQQKKALQEKECALRQKEEEFEKRIAAQSEQVVENAQDSAKVKELEEKIKEYEAHADSVDRTLALVEKTVYEAKMEAETLVREGKAEADRYRQETELQLEKKRKKNEDEFMLAKYKLMHYLQALNDTQNKLVKTYNELGELVEKLPLRIGDILSEDSFELLKDNTREEM